MLARVDAVCLDGVKLDEVRRAVFGPKVVFLIVSN